VKTDNISVEFAQPVLRRHDDVAEVSCKLTVGAASHDVFYRTSAPIDSPHAEPFLCLSLIPSMQTGENVVSQTPISAKMIESLPRIQNIFAGWYPELHRFESRMPSRAVKHPEQRGVGCFFSGGVDSFYSVLRHAEEIDTVIFAHGFDVPLSNTALRHRVSTALRAAAAALGKRLIEVETNAREFLDHYGNWGKHTHGSALASIAHLLAQHVRKVYVPSSGTRDEDLPWGSHPAVDGLWSSEAVEIVHDDDTVTRFDKVREIAKSDVALAHLRVCWENRDNAYNCGRCEKCMRTMMMLRLAGGLDRCGTFDTALDLAAVAQLRNVKSVLRRRYYQEVQDYAEKAGDVQMARAVQAALHPTHGVGSWFKKKAQGARRRLLGW
jgi:hypothetical protein